MTAALTAEAERRLRAEAVFAAVRSTPIMPTMRFMHLDTAAAAEPHILVILAVLVFARPTAQHIVADVVIGRPEPLTGYMSRGRVLRPPHGMVVCGPWAATPISWAASRAATTRTKWGRPLGCVDGPHN